MNYKQKAINAALSVRNENRQGYNTAARVGGAMIDVVEYISSIARFEIPHLRIEYRRRGFKTVDRDRLINIVCPLDEGHPIFDYNPRIVLLRKKIVSGSRTLERSRRIKYVEPGAKTFGSASINNQLSSLRNFRYVLRASTERYCPRRVGTNNDMTLDALINSFVSIQWELGELTLFTQKGKKSIFLQHTNGEPKRITADFALAIRIDNPSFAGNTELYPDSYMYQHTPRYLYGPLTKFKMGYESINYNDDGEWAYAFEPIIII